MEASLRHYSTLLPALGFSKTHDHVWSFANGFEIDLQPARHSQSYERHGPGVNHYSVSVESEDALKSIAEALLEAGLDVPIIQSFGNARSLFLPDPDGLRLEIAYDPD